MATVKKKAKKVKIWVATRETNTPRPSTSSTFYYTTGNTPVRILSSICDSKDDAEDWLYNNLKTGDRGYISSTTLEHTLQLEEKEIPHGPEETR